MSISPLNSIMMYSSYFHRTQGVLFTPFEPDPSLDLNCGICLVPLDKEAESHGGEGDKHPFHPDCIKKWIQIKPQCPVCWIDIDSPFPSSMEYQADRVRRGISFDKTESALIKSSSMIFNNGALSSLLSAINRRLSSEVFSSLILFLLYCSL